ncbi:hypothetical protein SAMN05421748_101993 [Paractinoplanes atraurantiacus]|uniref:Uncharacterized protein n=1 Tax=Paractinoplanes atraurantiacus TaxID=1036182 RepID=A0A285FK61_9ACTN|nr:hypothetical protein SAMN05421748_101993 [Actinoplanes atraurantiacus]
MAAPTPSDQTRRHITTLPAGSLSPRPTPIPTPPPLLLHHRYLPPRFRCHPLSLLHPSPPPHLLNRRTLLLPLFAPPHFRRPTFAAPLSPPHFRWRPLRRCSLLYRRTSFVDALSSLHFLTPPLLRRPLSPPAALRRWPLFAAASPSPHPFTAAPSRRRALSPPRALAAACPRRRVPSPPRALAAACPRRRAPLGRRAAFVAASSPPPALANAVLRDCGFPQRPSPAPHTPC